MSTKFDRKYTQVFLRCSVLKRETQPVEETDSVILEFHGHHFPHMGLNEYREQCYRAFNFMLFAEETTPLLELTNSNKRKYFTSELHPFSNTL
jgi:hypothetical protein